MQECFLLFWRLSQIEILSPKILVLLGEAHLLPILATSRSNQLGLTSSAAPLSLSTSTSPPSSPHSLPLQGKHIIFSAASPCPPNRRASSSSLPPPSPPRFLAHRRCLHLRLLPRAHTTFSLSHCYFTRSLPPQPLLP